MAKIYLAARYSRREELVDYATQLVSWGFQVTSRWFRKARGDFKSWDEFRESFATPAGFMVNVVFDQIFHLLCLLPLVVKK